MWTIALTFLKRPTILIILALTLAIPVAYLKGRSVGKDISFRACEKEKFEAFQTGANSRKEIDVDVKRLSYSDVVDKLAADKWLRD